jgi:hypothetical protein
MPAAAPIPIGLKRKRGDSVSDDQAEDISLQQRCIRSTDFSTALTDALMQGPPHVSTQHTHAHTHSLRHSDVFTGDSSCV